MLVAIPVVFGSARSCGTGASAFFAVLFIGAAILLAEGARLSGALAQARQEAATATLRADAAERQAQHSSPRGQGT